MVRQFTLLCAVLAVFRLSLGEDVGQSFAGVEDFAPAKRNEHHHDHHYPLSHVGRKCGIVHSEKDEEEMDQVMKDWEAQEPQDRRRHLQQSKALIDTYWHIIQGTAGGKTIGQYSNQLIKKAMLRLNRAFSNSPFKFVERGVNRTTNNAWFSMKEPPGSDHFYEERYKKHFAVRGKDVLNVYTGDLIGGQGLWGFAYYPNGASNTNFWDGVTLHNPLIKPNGRAIWLEMTLVHEVGHWLGLHHTYHNGCDKGGDRVSDTAAHTGRTNSFPGWRDCFKGKQFSSCPNNKKGVDPGFDPVYNFMNELPEGCEDMGEFSAGQVERMTAQYVRYRKQSKSVSCFKTNEELKKAVRTYANNPTNPFSSVAQQYGWPISSWCVDSVTDFSLVFANLDQFDEDISGWITTSATNMRGMFLNAKKFNQDVEHFDTSNVVDMARMFSGARNFNRPVRFDFTNVKDVTKMFLDASSFDRNMCFLGYSGAAGLVFNETFAGTSCASVADPDTTAFPPGPFCQVCTLGSSCFESNKDLRNAVREYLSYTDVQALKTSDLALRYGYPISEWCIDGLADLTWVFNEAPIWFNENLTGWNTSAATNMTGMFSRASGFNQDISFFDTSSVEDMSFMFQDALAFQQSIDAWDVSRVISFEGMFRGHVSYNSPLNSWDVSSARVMQRMFQNASSFNQPIGGWNTTMVVDMFAMFRDATSFNQNLDSWNVGKVTDMSSMFDRAESFNSNLSNWDVRLVVTFEKMFHKALAFNGSVQGWKPERAITMERMFQAAESFNQHMESWDVSLVNTTRFMFLAASSFNQNLKNWPVWSLMDAEKMFAQARAFNQNLCVWSRRLSSFAIVDSMFAATDCPVKVDPDFTLMPQGPFCYICDGSETPPSSMPSATPIAPSTPMPSHRPSSAPSSFPVAAIVPACKKLNARCAMLSDCCNAGTKLKCSMTMKCTMCITGGMACMTSVDCCSSKCIKMKGKKTGACKMSSMRRKRQFHLKKLS